MHVSKSSRRLAQQKNVYLHNEMHKCTENCFYSLEKGKNEVRTCLTHVMQRFFVLLYVFCLLLYSLFYLLNLLGNVYLVTCDLYVFKIDLVFCFYKINYELLFLYKWKSISWIPVDFFFFFLNLFMRRPKKNCLFLSFNSIYS